MMARCLALILLSLVCSTARGNIGFFGGSGRTIELAKSKEVQLVSEEVTITPMLGPSFDADQVMYRCSFVLKNRSPTATTAQVGFPLDADVHKGSALDDTDRVLSYHFIARDDHSTYHVRYVQLAPPAKYPELFVWDMAFSANEVKRLRIAYILPIGVAVASTARQEKGSSGNVTPTYGRPWYAKLEPCAFGQLTYITETASSWKGPIEDATFRVHTAGMAYWMSRRSDYFLAAVDPPPGSSEPQQLRRMKIGLTYLQLSPDGWNYDAESGYTTLRIRNYKPGTPVRFSWYGTVLPAEAAGCESVVLHLLGKRAKPQDVRALSDIVAAFYGIAPKSDSVRSFVERQVWYHPNSGLQRSELAENQRELLARLDVIESGGLSSPQGGDSGTPMYKGDKAGR